MKFTYIIFHLVFFFVLNSIVAQDAQAIKDEKKIQEVITLMADPAPMPPLPDGSIPVDTNGPQPMNSSEILKRAVNFAKSENKLYSKANGVTSGSKAECVVSFKYKPKELNPKADVEGVFSMHVSIEAKQGKYRYVITKINHIAKNPEFTGGDVYSEVPKCGTMTMPSEIWKKLKSEAFKSAALVADDIKVAMKIPSDKVVNADEW